MFSAVKGFLYYIIVTMIMAPSLWLVLLASFLGPCSVQGSIATNVGVSVTGQPNVNEDQPDGSGSKFITSGSTNNETEWEIYPVAGEAPQIFNETRRKLGSFQICALCTCCGGPKRLCLPSPCCYTINCNIPNRPFGFCSFTPKACNCFGCHL